MRCAEADGEPVALMDGSRTEAVRWPQGEAEEAVKPTVAPPALKHEAYVAAAEG